MPEVATSALFGKMNVQQTRTRKDLDLKLADLANKSAAHRCEDFPESKIKTNLSDDSQGTDVFPMYLINAMFEGAEVSTLIVGPPDKQALMLGPEDLRKFAQRLKRSAAPEFPSLFEATSDLEILPQPRRSHQRPLHHNRGPKESLGPLANSGASTVSSDPQSQLPQGEEKTFSTP